MGEQSEHIQHLPVKLDVLHGYGSWHPKIIVVIISKVTETNITAMRKLKCFKNYQNVTQRHKISSCCWKNGADRLTRSRIASLKLMSIESVMPSSHLIVCRPFSSCPQTLPASESFSMNQLFT